MVSFCNIFRAALMAVTMIGLVIGLTACEKSSQQQMPPPPQVSAVTVHKENIPVSYEYAGRIAAFKDTEVRAQVGGILLSRNFVEGAFVQKGDLLFEIDATPYLAEFARQNALVAQARANYQLALKDAVRAEDLWIKKVQSRAVLDQMIANRNAAAATLQQAEAALKSAQINLNYTKVIAPISGLTSREIVSEGSLIGVDPSSNWLTTITQNDPVYVNFSYSAGDAAQIRNLWNKMNAAEKKAVELTVQIHLGDRDYSRLGTVDFTSHVVDETTGTVSARAVVANPETILVPGQFVRVTLLGLVQAGAIAIPEISLQQDSIGTYVYVVGKENQVEQRYIVVVGQLPDRKWLLQPAKLETEESETGKVTEKQIGLTDGEIIVTQGQYHIGMMLGQMPPGVPLKVAIVELDSKPLTDAGSGHGAEQSK